MFVWPCYSIPCVVDDGRQRCISFQRPLFNTLRYWFRVTRRKKNQQIYLYIDINRRRSSLADEGCGVRLRLVLSLSLSCSLKFLLLGLICISSCCFLAAVAGPHTDQLKITRRNVFLKLLTLIVIKVNTTPDMPPCVELFKWSYYYVVVCIQLGR